MAQTAQGIGAADRHGVGGKLEAIVIRAGLTAREALPANCGAVVPNWTASFTGETEGDILAQVAEHARVDHGMTDIPAEVVAQVRSHIKDA